MLCSKAVKVAKDFVQAPELKTVRHAMRVDNPLSPFIAGFKPPWLLTILIDHLWVGQAPIAEFTYDQRQILAPASAILLRPRPLGATGKVGNPIIPLFGMIGDS